jgi:tetratricopeptide (TPR) repeat protein
MPSEVYEKPLELDIGLLEAGPPTRDSYPYPFLTSAGRSEKRTFRAVVLENPFLQATFIPALGGRLLSLLDKRTGIEILPQQVTLQPGGRRGAVLSAGIELHLDGRERWTSLGPVQFAAEEADEDRPAGLWLAEAVTGTGVSWHLHVTMPEGRAELRFEARIFNRYRSDFPYSSGLLLPDMGESRSDGRVFFTAGEGQGIALIPERGIWSACSHEGSVVLSRFKDPRILAPRQLDTWAVSLIPFSGMKGISGISEAGAVYVGSDTVQLQAVTQVSQQKLVLLTSGGQTLEAPVDLYPEKLLELGLPEPAKAVALMDQAKNVSLRWEAEWPSIVAREPSRPLETHRVETTDLESAAFNISTRHIANALLGNRAMAAGDFEEADARLEQSLLYNGEDHLSWWMKAMGKRLAGDEAEEVPELLNAHFLAPLEPALRAESFLRQPRSLEREPNALLKPLADYPESFIEVAALLVEAGLYEQASRWIDEALRHLDLPMLRYLLAYAHVQATTMDLEVADQLVAAARQPLSPPYPWRDVEIDAIETLAERFPADERLRGLLQLIQSSRS